MGGWLESVLIGFYQLEIDFYKLFPGPATVGLGTSEKGGIAMTRYLRQLKTGAIYIMTDILAKRRDMVPYDAEQAKNRIAAIKQMLVNRQPNPEDFDASAEEAALVKASAMELAGLEAKLENVEKAEEKAIEEAALPDDAKKLNDQEPITNEQAAEQLKQDMLNDDPKYQKALSLKSRNEVEEYMLLEFGQEIEISRPFKDLKAYALEKTVNRILEG